MNVLTEWLADTFNDLFTQRCIACLLACLLGHVIGLGAWRQMESSSCYKFVMEVEFMAPNAISTQKTVAHHLVFF